MKPPLILDNKGDMLIFRTTDAALAYAEVVDVEAGEYQAFDSEGRMLTLGTGKSGRFGKKRVIVTVVEEPPRHQAELKARLLRFMLRAGIPVDASGDLDVIVDSFARWHSRG
jgi:hypothetical protein